MRAPLLQAAGPSISRAAELMNVLREREATFFWWSGSRLFGLPSWARQGAASGVTPAGVKVWKVVFCVGESRLTTENERFTYTGAAVPWRSGKARTEPEQSNAGQHRARAEPEQHRARTAPEQGNAEPEQSQNRATQSQKRARTEPEQS